MKKVNQQLKNMLSKLLEETEKAHRKEFEKFDGEDVNWPEWYAEYMLKKGLDKILVSENE